MPQQFPPQGEPTRDKVMRLRTERAEMRASVFQEISEQRTQQCVDLQVQAGMFEADNERLRKRVEQLSYLIAGTLGVEGDF